MFDELKRKVWEANLRLPKLGLVLFTWGNVSAADRQAGVFAIKPGGVEYDAMSPEDMVVLDFDGKVVDGRLKPSSDTATHLEIYRAFEGMGGVVHTHSTFAVAWAQAGRSIPCLGTTHADTFYGEIPCTRDLTREETETEYEANTGRVIVETFAELDPTAVPGVICRSHGPFAWGPDCDKAVYNAAVLEESAKMALYTLQIDPLATPAPDYIKDKHYLRKHGPGAYYGQGSN